MITKSKAFLTTDGKTFLSLEEAQQHELDIIFTSSGMGVDEKLTEPVVCNAVAAVMSHKDEVLAILSTRKPRTPKAKPVKATKARAAVNAQLQDIKQ